MTLPIDDRPVRPSRWAGFMGDGEVIIGENEPVTATVVPITPSHHAFERVAALFDDYRAHYGRSRSPRITHAWLQEQLTQHRMEIAAALHADQVCGLITATVMPASLTLGTAWSIRDLYVTPDYRRSGVARALLSHVIEAARTAGATRVSLQTESGNIPALTLYAAAGFELVTGLELLNLVLAPDDEDLAPDDEDLAPDDEDLAPDDVEAEDPP